MASLSLFVMDEDLVFLLLYKRMPSSLSLSLSLFSLSLFQIHFLRCSLLGK